MSMETGVSPISRIGFSLRDAFFLESRDIWLALDDSFCSDYRVSGGPLTPESGWVYWTECQSYNKQLFYWLMLRKGLAFLFPTGGGLFGGLPKFISPHN